MGVDRDTCGACFFLAPAFAVEIGEPIRAFIEKRLTLVMWLFLFALVGGFAGRRWKFFVQTEAMSLPYPTRTP